MLTPAQEDYIEIIYRLELSRGRGKVRITDIATELGTRLPTVTRTVQRLTELNLVNHVRRRTVSLSEKGQKIAQDILHRHNDLVRFFTEVLGLTGSEAEVDACQIEHGISGKTAQRLHEFLEYVGDLGDPVGESIRKFKQSASHGRKDFAYLPSGRAAGWRT